MEIRLTGTALRRAAGLCLVLCMTLWGRLVQAYDIPTSAANCVSCHGNPFGKSQPPFVAQPMNEFWSDATPATTTTVKFREFLQARGGSMAIYANGSSITDPQLATLLPYFMQIRNAQVQLNGAPDDPATPWALQHSYTFATAVYKDQNNPAGENLKIRITNLRQFQLSFTVSGGGTAFPSTSSCTTVAAAAHASNTSLTTQSCDIDVKFKAPATAGDATATLNIGITFTGGSPAAVQHQVALKGTSLGQAPAPGFSPSGFDALTGFSALPTGSQTLCPTIRNSGTAPLSLSFSALAAADSSADYFEIGNNASCPVSATSPACTSARSTISGSATLAAGATCTLPVRFNPAKFSDASALSPRSATLQVTHDAATGPIFSVSMSGIVATPPPPPPPQPSLGLSTNPAANPATGRVSPPAFATQAVNTTSAVWSEALVFNNGPGDGLDLTEVTHTNPLEFALTETCVAAAPLAKVNGGVPHCAISLRFTPNTTGERCTTFTVRAAVGGNGSATICGTGMPAPPPVVIAQAKITSPATRVVVGATLTLSGMDSTPPNGVTYQWAVRDPANVTTQAGTAATQNVTFAAVGSYRIMLTVQPSAGGTPSSDFMVITVDPTPVTPAPVYSASGFDALAGFSASTAGSQTLCPTIQNIGNAPLSLSFSALQAAGSSANFSGYFELADSASCPATPRACNTSQPAGSPISGSTELQTPADSACTLAVRFNPAKFGDAGGTGARSATLRVVHNAPAATVADYSMIGSVTPVPLPRIGMSTNPSAVDGRVSPPAFASQPLGTTSTLWNEFQVFNNGIADGLDLTEVANSNPQEFSLTETCVSAPPLARLGAGNESSCTIALRFAPKTLGERCTTITVRATASSNGAQSLLVCATAVAAAGPAITLSRDTIDFGRRFISAAYLPQPLVISNGAGATAFLQINALTLVGSGFALVPNGAASQTPCVGTSLPPGASCTVQVQFVPDPARPETRYSASLQIDTNDAAAPRRTVALDAIAGTVATPPVLQLPGTPPQIEFTGVVVAGQQSAQPLSVTLRNAGPGKAAIDAIRMVGADASSFSASGCPASLEHEESCVISVRFVPGSGGLKRAQLEILAASSVPPMLVTVTGRGVGGTSAFLTASVPGLTLGEVRVGAQSVPVEVRLASAGEGVVQVTGLQASGPFTVQAKTCPTPPFTLPRGADCTVSVTFTPTAAGAATAILRIGTDADAKAIELPLTGSGQASASLSSGGCSMASGDTLVDPTLWLLVLLAIAALVYRHRARVAHRP